MNDIQTAVMHDIKNQLADLALRLHRRADARVEMEIAMNASRRLSEMLLLSREDSSLNVNADAVNPADFMKALAAEYAEFYPEITVEVDGGRAPECAFFDDVLIRMALANALHNACRHAASRVRFVAYEQSDMLVMEISDDGPGYPAHVLETAGKLPVAASAAGTGLGLYLANRIAGLHCLKDRCGHIELANGESGRGARFRMYLP